MEQRDVKRRKRTSLVCEPCRKRKIKCDKGQPCNHCIKSKKTEGCVYNPEALDILEKKSKVLPYMQSARTPLNMNKAKSQIKKEPNAGITEPDGEQSELDILKKRLQYLENTVLINKNVDPEVIPLNYSGKVPFRLPINGRMPSQTNTADNDKPMIPPISGFEYQYQVVPTPDGRATPVFPRLSQSYPQSQQLQFPSISKQASPQSQSQSQLPPLNFQDPIMFSATPKDSVEDSTGTNSVSGQNSVESQYNYSPSSGTTTSYTPIGKDSIIDGITGGTKPKREPKKRMLKENCLCGTNPYGSPDDSINFYEGYSAVFVKGTYNRVAFGPFAWSSLWKKDPGLKLLWDYSSKTQESNVKAALFFINNKDQELSVETSKVLSSTNDNEKSINLDENVFEKRLLEPEGVSDMMPYYKLIKNQVAQKLEKASTNQDTLHLGLTYVDSKLDVELRLIDKIQLFLPKRKVIWKLLLIFFQDVYPFMPFLVEKCFRQEIEKILGPEKFVDEKIEKINIERRLDLAHIGILCILLRLSYLSLFTNRNEINENRLKSTNPEIAALHYRYLLSNPISMNIIDIAQECLDQFNMFRQPSLPVFQLTYYLKLYHYYAPEDGDGADGGASFIMLGLLLSMAKSLGLHRDPSTIEGIEEKDRSLNTLTRRMWTYLEINDLHEASAFGNSLKICSADCDTKAPIVIPGEEALVDTALDKFINQSLSVGRETYRPLEKILRKILDVRGQTKMKELCEVLGKFELSVYDEYGDLSDCLQLEDNPYNEFSRTFRTKFYIAIKGFLLTIYFHFYIYYENKNIVLSFFYLKKLLLVCVDDIMPHYFKLIGNIKCDLVINPTFEQFIHKTNHIFFGIIIRVNLIIFCMKSQPDHERKCSHDTKYLRYFKSLCKTSSSITRCLEVSIAVISKISNRYYHAWRITKGHTSLLRLVTKKEFYEDCYHKAGKLSEPVYTIDQIDEIVSICEGTLIKLGKHKDFVFSPEVFDNKSDKDSVSETPSQSVPDIDTPFNPLTPMREFDFKPSEPPFTTPAGPNVDDLNGKTENKDLTGGFNLDFVNNAEIDNLWLQLLSSKIESNPDLQSTDFGDMNKFVLDNADFNFS